MQYLPGGTENRDKKPVRIVSYEIHKTNSPSKGNHSDTMEMRGNS
jgi:hypothetical protein